VLIVPLLALSEAFVLSCYEWLHVSGLRPVATEALETEVRKKYLNETIFEVICFLIESESIRNLQTESFDLIWGWGGSQRIQLRITLVEMAWSLQDKGREGSCGCCRCSDHCRLCCRSIRELT
jgi:hypothetical protein